MTAVREPTSAAVRNIFGKMGEFKALWFKQHYSSCGLDRCHSLSSLKKPTKARIPLSLCIHRELTKTSAEGAEQIILLHSVTICFPLFTIYFYIMSLKWSPIDSKWISLWGKQTEIERIAILQIKGNHRGRFFKVPWQQNTEILKFDENMGQR